MTPAIELIYKERERQINELGYNEMNYHLYGSNQLLDAANCYLNADTMPEKHLLIQWPWTESTFKPTPNDRISELVKAAALIAAQIDRELQLKSR